LVLPSLADALIVIILLIPGFIAFFIFKRLGSYGGTLTEFETTVWSFFFSAIVVFVYIIVTKLTDIDAIRDHFFDPLNFGILFVITMLVALISGYLFKIKRVGYSLGEPWIQFSKEYTERVRNSPNFYFTLTVITKDGQEYEGAARGWGGRDNKEILLDYPYQIIRDDLGNKLQKIQLGTENQEASNDTSKILFRSDDIARLIAWNGIKLPDPKQ
jgi:hypothetical protein